jgi:hypothetical protein
MSDPIREAALELFQYIDQHGRVWDCQAVRIAVRKLRNALESADATKWANDALGAPVPECCPRCFKPNWDAPDETTHEGWGS